MSGELKQLRTINILLIFFSYIYTVIGIMHIL